MKKARLFAQILALLLCAVLLFPLAALAEGDGEGGGNPAIPKDPDSYAVIDPDALQQLVEDYIRTHNVNADKISVGYCYLDTGDTWYYNPDTWYFSASMYKVPLMMIFAEWESQGKITQQTEMKGLTLEQAERYIIVYNSTDYAKMMMGLIGTDREVRTEYQRFSSLSEEYYDPDFYDYSYFTARFTTDVIKTLYYENERFPQIIETMKKADNDQYFHGALRGAYEVAQKSGSFVDRRGVQYNHNTGIIYTPHPFILTVMTQDMGTNQNILRDLAVIFKDYTLGLDEAYALWEQNKDQPAPAAETPAPTEAPAPETPAETEAPAAQPEEGAETGETPAEEAQPAQTEETQPAQEGEITPVAEPDQELAHSVNGRLIVLLLGAALLVILLLSLVVRKLLRRQKKGRKQEQEYLY